MTLGIRLVIPGTIFGSLFLVGFLLLITAGVSYPAPVLAAPSEPEVSDSNQNILMSAPSPELAPSPVSAPSPEIAPAPESAPPPIESTASEVAVEGAACEVSPKFPDKILRWCELITEQANRRGLPPDLIAALILQESGGNPTAYSKSGAVGLMQVMPRDGLAAGFMCVNGPCFSNRPTIAELEDPGFNVSYGTKMLAGLLNKKGNMRDALKSYGPMNVGYYYADIVLGLYERYR